MSMAHDSSVFRHQRKSPAEEAGTGGSEGGGSAGVKKRVLWLHSQPEHYFNCMIDDLARGDGYFLPGMAREGGPEVEYVAAFTRKGPGWYKDNPQPAVARTI